MTASAQHLVTRHGRRRMGTPCVVFLDDARWAAFHQLAPLLPRAGVRTIRVSTGLPTGSMIAFCLVYDRYEVLSPHSDADALGAILADENVVDIQFVETLGNIVRSNLSALDAGVSERLWQRLAVQDKLCAAHLFADAGVRTPAVVPVAEASPDDMAARFGFPVVVKERVGSAGANVVIASDIDALIAAVGPLDGTADNRYYEQYVDGAKLKYAAAISSTGVEQELSYRVIRWLLPAGTVSEVQTISDPQLEAFGRRAVGGAVCFRSAGIDISQGYLRAIEHRLAPAACAKPVADVQFPVFPTCLREAVESGRITRTAMLFMHESWRYLRWVGIGYWLSEALAIAHSVRTRRRTPTQQPAAAPLDSVLVGLGASVALPDEAR
jgi:hypothetical protein